MSVNGGRAASASSDRVDHAVARLLLRHPWWASLLLNLQREASVSISAMATDGSSLFYNEAFVDRLSPSELEALLMHQAGHCALLHPYRRLGRDAVRWNVACDAAVNALLVADGIKLAPDAIPPAAIDQTAEEIYDKIKPLPLPMEDLMDAKGEGEAGNGGQGQANRMSASDWKAAVSSMHGVIPAGIRRSISRSLESERDWRTELAVFASASLRGEERTWTRRSRRVHNLPGRRPAPQTRVGICVDTSGSIPSTLLRRFVAEMQAIVGLYGVEAYILPSDAAVYRVYQPGEPWDIFLGGGGTDFRPALRKCAELQVDAIVYLTDGYGDFGPELPIPTLWAISTAARAPWGKTVFVH